MHISASLKMSAANITTSKMSADQYILGVKLWKVVELHLVNRASTSVSYEHVRDCPPECDLILNETIEDTGKRHMEECAYPKSNVCGLVDRVIQDWATSETADSQILQVIMDDEVEPYNPLEPPRPYISTEHSENYEINPNNHSQANMKELILKMTCIDCSLIVTPNVQYKCHEGHIFCEYCKGSRPVSHCSKCLKLIGYKRRIGKNPLKKATQIFIQEADAYIGKCSTCQMEYYDLGNGENQHSVLNCPGNNQVDVQAGSENNPQNIRTGF